MAVDTRQKRMSMLNFGDGANLHVLWEPDGTVDADDRLHLLDLYSGIAAAGPGIVYSVSRGIFEYVAANWGSTLAFFFQVYHRAASGKTLHAQLFDVTTSTAVAGSDLSTASATNVRQQSGDLKAELTDGDVYEARWGNAGAGVAEHAKVRIH